MEDFLFQTPWWAPAGLAALGIGIWSWGNNRLRRREKRIGLGLVLLAMALALVSYLVDTPAETVERLTRQLVTAVVKRDSAQIGALLHPNAIAFNWDKQDIVNGAQYYAERTGLSGARITGLRVEKDGRDLVSYLGVWSQHLGGTEMPMTDLTSQWKLQWVGSGKQWQIIEITPLQIGNAPREQIERRYLEQPAPKGR